jgi:hypothetical protein
MLNKTIREVYGLKNKIVLGATLIFLILSCSKMTYNVQVPIDSLSSDLEILIESDYNLLKKYADTCKIEDAAGQLFMVGLPTDIARYKQDKAIDKIISELHIILGGCL